MKSRYPVLFCLSGIASLLYGIYLLSDVPVQLKNKPDKGVDAGAYFAHNELKKMDAALDKKISLDTFNYIATFESPFRKRGEDPSGNTANKKQDLSGRPKLVLKGILQKNAPLAILEDENGQTYIRGLGEKALDQEIFKIIDNKVTLRDSRGNYDLVVEEN
jgi:hypothetical protein